MDPRNGVDEDNITETRIFLIFYSNVRHMSEEGDEVV